MIYFLKIALLVCGALLTFTHCKMQTKTSATSSTIIVKAEPNITTLFYSGNIKPIETVTVNNIQADGIISKKNFSYGDIVKKNQLLFLITSSQLAKNYQDALSSFAKAQKNYSDTQFQMHGAEELSRLKIMSKQDYLNTKTQLFNAALDLAQTKRQLESILQEIGTSISSIDIRTINRALARVPNVVKVTAPATGVALLPESTSSSKETTNVPLSQGSSVKAGQTLLSIGNMSGISVTAKVTEIYVDKIKAGQKAIITGDAFPEQKLAGTVTHVDRQASSDSQSGGIPSFALTVSVPTLTQVQLNKILVGMSATITLPIVNSYTISIPLSAVFIKQGQPMVKRIDAHSKKIIDVPVNTGRTEMNSVAITEGLQNGDEVLVNATAN